MHTFIEFEVQAEQLEKARELINTFIEQIKINEPGTIYYQSYQNNDNPTKFIHAMSFKDDASREFHRNSAYCREFVDALYPICSTSPLSQNFELLNEKPPSS